MFVTRYFVSFSFAVGEHRIRRSWCNRLISMSFSIPPALD